MKFIKENLTLVICGAVVLVAVALFWYMTGPAQASIKETMKQRYAQANRVKQMANMSIELPGVATQKGPPSRAYIEARQGLNEHLTRQQTEVAAASRTLNARGRVTTNGTPLLPLPRAGSAGTEMRGFLPVLRSPAMEFKAAYGEQFRLWRGMLATGQPSPIEPTETVPPSAEALKASYDETQKALPVVPGATQFGAQSNPRELQNYMRRLVVARANELRMYVDTLAFQTRPFLDTTDPPDAQQIFESLVDSWFQSDVVKAIVATNTQPDLKVGPLEKNIEKSPVKRLFRITVGSGARASLLGSAALQAQQTLTRTDPGSLFYTSASEVLGADLGAPGPGMTPVLSHGGASGGDAEPPPDVNALPNTIDYEFGMTGHSSGSTYDVVLMAINLDIEPAHLNVFINELYRQNMGYTVLNVQLKAVDPTDRASHGYLYGNKEVVEAEILVEGLLLRSWTLPLMPDGIKRQLGLSTTAQPGQ